MLEVSPLILQRMEGFVFNLPTRTAAADQVRCVVRGDLQIGDPTETPANRTVRCRLGVLQKVHPQIDIRLVQRQVVGKTDFAGHGFLLVVARPAQRGNAALRLSAAHRLEQVGVIIGLGSQQEVHVQAFQFAEVRRVAGQAVFHNDQPEVRLESFATDVFPHCVRSRF